MNLTVNKTFPSFNVSTNSSSSDEQWSILPTIVAVNFAVSLAGNGFLLILFLRKGALQTPFNIYLINLLASNLCTTLVQYPFDITSSFGLSGTALSDSACSLYVYASWIFMGATFNAHMMIALTRIWAMVHPISYRNHHSSKVAFLMCCGMWIYVHATMLPYVIQDALYYRLPIAENGCNSNAMAQPGYNLFMILVLFCWPEIVMWIAFPIIICAKAMRRIRPAQSESTAKITFKNGFQLRSITVDQEHSTNQRRNEVSEGTNCLEPRPVIPRNKAVKQARVQATMVLASLTLAVTIFWTPSSVDYVVECFYPNYVEQYPTFHSIALTLVGLQTSVDPIVLVLGVKPLRDTFKSVITGRGFSV